MKIIIAGDGKVGNTLTRKLSIEGHDLTLIDVKSDVIERSVEQYDVMAIHGNCASMHVLMEAGIKNADMLIAVTGADEINLLCCLTAHNLNRDIHTIARIRNPEYADQIYKMRDAFGLSLTVNPEKMAAVEVERVVKYPGFLKRDSFVKGRVQIVELRVDGDSPLDKLRLYELNNVLHCNVLVCAVQRNGTVEIPDGNFVLYEGDRIFVTGPTNELAALLKGMGIITNKVRRVMICGGGKMSFYLAQQLQRTGIDVEVIEQDKERCVELATALPNATIVNGDATSSDVLDSEGIDDYDAIVTATGLDEMNIIISLYAKKHGVPQVITKVGHMENAHIEESLPIGSVIRPKEFCCNHIVQYVRAVQNKVGAALAIHSIADGQAEAMEFVVDTTTKNTGVQLKDIKMKKQVLVVSISHGNITEFSSGSSCFRVGDKVVVVASGGHVIQQLNDIFE